MKENEVNVAILKPEPPYTCKLLKLLNGKNLVEPKNENFVAKMYTFNVTKCDEIFDLLVADGKIIVPNGAKVPPLKQRKKKCFCKFHNFLSHKTSQCVLFRNLVQNSPMDGMVKFADKQKQRPQEDVEINVEALFFKSVDIMVVDTVDKADTEYNKESYKDHEARAYPKAE